MRYWWVNQNKTFEQETQGGYIWSPKLKSNGTMNPYYEFMREVAPGDLVYSFQGTLIRAIGVVRCAAYESPKPKEFGESGAYWNNIGWRVDVKYYFLNNQIRPKDHMNKLWNVLPSKYSPIQKNGNGNQSVYLAYVNHAMAEILNSLIGQEAQKLAGFSQIGEEISEYGPQKDVAIGLLQWEDHLADSIQNDESLITEKEAIIMARRGQGKFKESVCRYERKCRITEVDRIEHLIASHIKPWRDCDDHQERLDGTNGLLLTPTIDHLFDRGYISFENNGELLVSPRSERLSLNRMGIKTDKVINVGAFNQDQKNYLDYHRDSVFLQSRIEIRD